MRVLLIVPTVRYKETYPAFLSITDFPTGFAYLAAALKKAGHEVLGLSANNDPKYSSAYEMVFNKISKSLIDFEPHLIGLGGLCIDFAFLKDVINLIRKFSPNIPIVCGGRIVTYDAEFILNNLRPNFCIIGEGEEPLVELANMIENNHDDYEAIANLGYWQKNQIKFTKREFKCINLDERAFPDYEPFGIHDMLDNFSMTARNLFRYTRLNPRPMVIVTARGCPFNCTFCVHEQDSKYRSRSIENILLELNSLYEKYHFNILMMQDELFAVNKLRMNKFSLELIDAKKKNGWDFDWTFQTHASASLDQESLELAKRAGCYFFSYGLESASPRVLLSMNKRTKPQAIEKAITIANSVGIGFGGNFIFGDEAETEETISETMNFFYRHCLDLHINLAAVQPYPGSKLFKRCLERGIIRNKVNFYENIDRLNYNMTSLPDNLWFTWLRLMIFFSSSFPWVKSTSALSCEEDLDANQGPMIPYLTQSIFTISAKCPLCGKTIHCKEFLKKSIQQQNEHSIPFQEHLNVFHIFRRLFSTNLRRINELVKLFVLVSPRCLIFKSPLLKSLKGMEDNVRNIFVITGCPSCNRLIKIIIPHHSRNSTLFKIRKFLFKYI